MLGIRQQVELEEVEEVTPGGPPDMHDHIIAKTPEEKLQNTDQKEGTTEFK